MILQLIRAGADESGAMLHLAIPEVDAGPVAAYCRYPIRGEAFDAPKVAFNPADYETRQVFYTSKDGTRVPMFLTHRKGLKTGPETPTLLYAYGGFNVSLTPAFSVAEGDGGARRRSTASARRPQ